MLKHLVCKYDNNFRCTSRNYSISKKYSLPSIHFSGPVKKVRLGDLNINSNKDDADVQEYTVAEQIVHPEYKPPKIYNDIALLKLDRRVNFTKSVRPACLQVDEQLNDNKLIATGWGVTEFGGERSEQLMKVTLDLFTNAECAEYYNSRQATRKLPDGIVSSMLCTGGKTEPKGTCQVSSLILSFSHPMLKSQY